MNTITEEPVNRDFVMLFRAEKSALFELGRQDALASVLLNFLLLNMDTENCLIISGETLAEQLGWSVRTVRNKVKLLYEQHFIDILKSGNTNIYAVNANIAWSTYANKRQYAKFTARVIISKAEQEERRKTKIVRTARVVTCPA